MQDRNVIGGATAAFLSPFVSFYEGLAPFLLLALILIVVDSRFGILAARKRGEAIRPSRKWRRAINKLVDYICWITLAGMIGRTFGEKFHIPLLACVMLVVVYAIELTSIFNNYFEYKGLKKTFIVWKFFAKVTNHPEIEECVEDRKEEEREHE